MRNKFKSGDKVITIKEGEIRRGVVAKTFPEIPTVIVKFDGGDIEKINAEYLTFEPKTEKAPETEIESEEKKSKPIFKSEITITPEEFKNISADVATRLAIEADTPTMVIAFAIFGSKLAKALFAERG